MTGQAGGHAGFDELAAGYVLHALEPADEQRFLRHAGRCLRCRHVIARFRRVAEALAETAPPAEPGGGLGDRILDVALAGAGPQDSPAGGSPVAGIFDLIVVDDVHGNAISGPPDQVTAVSEPALSSGVPRLRSGRPVRWRRRAAAAAAVALMAGGGIWAGLASPAPGSRPPLAACARPHACARVTLTATATGRTAATVIVYDGGAWMEAAAMAANPAGEIYVLWQITGRHTPLPVGSFDIRPGARSPVRIGGLAAPYAGTWAFAVSLEHGRTIPASPSRPVALGQVS